MNQPTTSDASAATAEDQNIRERVKGFTNQVLQQGRVDPDAVREIVRAVIGGTPGTPAASGAEAREMFSETVRTLAEALLKSASETHRALQQLAARGKDFTDNDLKEALVSLRRLEQDYTAAASRIGEAMSTNLRHEMLELTAHAKNVGVEASARVAGLLGQFAGAIGAAPAMANARGASARVTLAFSGVLAGVADALRDQPKPTSDT